ncbi:MAG: HAMP domain-containing protein [Candidatus Sabulitectum sp.]|nr:HAMP domain-containing protein [Candidatus Sabulitectum sp.]
MVATGDFDQRVKVETDDEIESMVDSFKTMTGNQLFLSS